MIKGVQKSDRPHHSPGESTTLLPPASPLSPAPGSTAAAEAAACAKEIDLELDLHGLEPMRTRSDSFSLLSPSMLAEVQRLDANRVNEFGEELEPVVLDELRKLLTLVYPVVGTYVLEYLPGLVCITLVGHIESPQTKEYVDAATLSTMFTNVSGLSIGFGLSSALDTLCSQAYGAGSLKKIGIFLQSAMLVVGSCLIPLFLMNWHAEFFLNLLGQDPQVAQLAGEFSKYTVFGMPFLFFYEMIRKLLQAQNIVAPLVVIAVIGNLVNILSGYYLTYHTSMGFYGAALARSLGYIVMPLLLLPYFLITHNHRQWWSGWNLLEAKRHVALFLRLGIPGMLMMAMEWWAYEVLALMAGLLPNGVVSISAHAVLMNVVSGLYMFYLGVAVSGNIRVGNCLGANLPKTARLVSRITLTIVTSLACLFALLLYLYRYEIPRWMINDPESIERAAQTLRVLVPYEIVEGANCVIQGIYRGTGRQDMAAKTNAIAFYVIGIPLAGLLAFPLHFEVEGLWIGFGAGILTALIVCSTVLYHSSWQQMANEARERTMF